MDIVESHVRVRVSMRACVLVCMCISVQAAIYVFVSLCETLYMYAGVLARTRMQAYVIYSFIPVPVCC